MPLLVMQIRRRQQQLRAMEAQRGGRRLVQPHQLALADRRMGLLGRHALRADFRLQQLHARRHGAACHENDLQPAFTQNGDLLHKLRHTLAGRHAVDVHQQPRADLHHDAFHVFQQFRAFAIVCEIYFHWIFSLLLSSRLLGF